MNWSKVTTLRLLGWLLITAPMLLGEIGPATLCSTVVGRLVNQLTFKIPIDETARVELRRCAETESGALQIAAWEAKASKPSLVIDTTDFTIVQTASRQNIYVIETTGGPRDRIYVVLYEKGKPTLKLQRVTRGTATITMTRDSLELVIPDIYAGDLPPRTEKYRYPLE